MQQPARTEPDVDIRPATTYDAKTIIEVILDAGTMFRGVGMAAVSDNPPPSPDEIRAHIQAGHVWVAVVGGGVVGGIIVGVLDSNAHIEQVSTARAYADRGVGRRLVAHAEDWARTAGHRRLTLTTFSEVAWKAPYHLRLGYRIVPADELGPELAEVRAEEARSGLDVWAAALWSATFGLTADWRSRRDVTRPGPVADGWARPDRGREPGRDSVSNRPAFRIWAAG